MMPARIDFESLFEHSPNAYVLLARDLSLVAVNAAYLRATGLRREELVGRKLFDVFPGDPAGTSDEAKRKLQASFERAFNSGCSETFPLIHYPLARPIAGGVALEERYWSGTHTPIFNSNGEVQFVLQHAVDVTELQSLKKALQEVEAAHETLPPREQLEAGIFSRAQVVQDVNRSLHAERQHLLQLFQQAPGFICFLRGPEHIFELASDAYYQLVGHRELLGLRVREALPEIEGQGFIALLDEVYRTGKPHLGRDVKILVQRHLGGPLTEAFVNYVFQPIFDRSGAVTGIFVQGNDVTEQHLTQEELDRYRAQLEDLVLERTRALNESEAALRQAQKMEAVGRLTGGVAHDFNNLLQIISGNLQLLQRDLQEGDLIQRRLAAALESVERGAKLASQLLAFARRQPLAPSVVHLNSLLQGMDELLQRALGEGVALEIAIVPKLWNTFVDPSQLENVLLNLAINARDAMQSGGDFCIQGENVTLASPEAEALGLAPGEYVFLSITDTGCGMPPEVVEQVFEPFFTTKPEGQGTGLGLSMVYGFVKQSGGQIDLRSELGEGTAIDIWLPRAAQQEEPDPVQLPNAVVGGDETILVVEDDEGVRQATVDLLQELGYSVLEAHDGASGLQMLQRHPEISLLFTDVIMPGPVTSVEMARQAQRLLPHVQVLFTSGYTDDALVHDGRLEPGVNLLSKPFRRESLASRIRHLLNNAQQLELAQEAMTPNRIAEPRAMPSPAGRVMHILLVEDEEVIREALQELLTDAGYHSQAVGSAEEAERLLEENSFDVLFTDVSLPGKSGIDLAVAARDRVPGLRVIIASGYSREAPVMQSAELADAVFLPKPYDICAVERILAEIASSLAAVD